MYNTSTFLKDGKSILDVDVEISSIEDAYTKSLHIQYNFEEELQRQAFEEELHLQNAIKASEEELQRQAFEEELHLQNSIKASEEGSQR